MSLYLGEQKIPGVKVSQEAVDHAVLYVPQTLNETQKKIARDNIGAISADVILTAIDGRKYKLVVTSDGALSTEETM